MKSGPVGDRGKTARMHPPVPIDPELLLAHRLLTGGPPPTVERLPALRAEDAAEVPPLDELRRGGRFRVEERLAPGPDGAPEVPLLVCTPTGPGTGRPVFLHVHGGGFFSGDHRVGLDAFLDEAEHLGAVLVSVGYRLAPEHRYPAQLDDVLAGLSWVVADADGLGADPSRIVVAGTSAGGGLAAALALRLRDDGGPRLLGQLLLCPMLDDRDDSASVRQMDGVDVWDRRWNGFGWDALLGGSADRDAVPPHAAPARARDLAGLPPAFLDVGSAESLRDEVVEYARRIQASGGEAELHVWSGGYHVFDWGAPEARISLAARAARRSWLERLLSDDRAASQPADG